ncbi:MAG: ferredoxin reductase [Chloroflexi bacterium]|nr:ferredoxin reductase [Chloroflexota bacterium]
MQKRISWQKAIVEKIIDETPRAKTYRLRFDDRPAFRSGQHYDVRLTAPDGYQAQRSYSIASAPELEGVIELTIEMIENGEVSPFFHEVVQVGDEIEMRGPIGGPFTWASSGNRPLLLLAGGSGIVPLMSMLRHRSATGSSVRAALIYSARTENDVIFRDEITTFHKQDPKLHSAITLTRETNPDWTGERGRVRSQLIEDALAFLKETPQVFACGSDGFVETVASLALAAGVPFQSIRTERFGPPGS